jgi:hypothetical protein
LFFGKRNKWGNSCKMCVKILKIIIFYVFFIFKIQRKRSSLYKDLVVALIDETIAEFTKNGRLSSCLLPAQIRNVLNSLACHGINERENYFHFLSSHNFVIMFS